MRGNADGQQASVISWKSWVRVPPPLPKKITQKDVILYENNRVQLEHKHSQRP